jgi:hypothetical protein
VAAEIAAVSRTRSRQLAETRRDGAVASSSLQD